MLGTDLADRVDWIRKTMSAAEVSSSGHPEDVATIVVNGVLARAEQDQRLTSNAVYVHEAMGVKPVRGCANLLIESLSAMIQPVELWLERNIPAVNRQARRMDQEQGCQEVWTFWDWMSFRHRSQENTLCSFSC